MLMGGRDIPEHPTIPKAVDQAVRTEVGEQTWQTLEKTAEENPTIEPGLIAMSIATELLSMAAHIIRRVNNLPEHVEDEVKTAFHDGAKRQLAKYGNLLRVKKE